MATENKYTPAVGDWVRFMRGGMLEIAVIEYFSHDRYGYHKYSIVTTRGVINETEILETRRVRVREDSD